MRMPIRRPRWGAASDRAAFARPRRRIWSRLDILEVRTLLSVAPMAEPIAQPAVGATPYVTNSTPHGLTPAQVRRAYGFDRITFDNGTIIGDGTGQTIAIVDAYDDPNIFADLQQFDRTFGLPDPRFTKAVQVGTNTVDPGWSLETALDVEWAHAAAPGANILLVEAKSASYSDLMSAVDYARSRPGVVSVSMSWGSGEFSGENLYDSHFTTPAGHIGGSGLAGGVTFVAASGDYGAWSGPDYPASSPNVLAVGGTRLTVGTNGTYVAETGWSGSGGGVSAFETEPAYQLGVQHTGRRTTPDVALNADPTSGYSVYSTVTQSNGSSGWFTVGGTSAAAPQWAALVAIVDQGLALTGQGSLAGIQSAVYSVATSAFHDVTSGSNGYLATAGYDAVTGLGSPVAAKLVAGLVSAANGTTVTIAAPTATPESTTVLDARIVVVSPGSRSSDSSSGSTQTVILIPINLGLPDASRAFSTPVPVHTTASTPDAGLAHGFLVDDLGSGGLRRIRPPAQEAPDPVPVRPEGTLPGHDLIPPASEPDEDAGEPAGQPVENLVPVQGRPAEGDATPAPAESPAPAPDTPGAGEELEGQSPGFAAALAAVLAIGGIRLARTPAAERGDRKKDEVRLDDVVPIA